MNKKQWGNVNLPKQIIERIRKVIPWVGYSSVAEYVRDAVRDCVAGTFCASSYMFLTRSDIRHDKLRHHELYVDNREETLRREKEE